jgi:hypothetical protein
MNDFRGHMIYRGGKKGFFKNGIRTKVFVQEIWHSGMP